MTPQEIQQIAYCLTKRVQPKDAEEGGALLVLTQKLVAHFQPKLSVVPDIPKADGK